MNQVVQEQDETEAVKELEAVEVTVDSLLRVLAGENDSSRAYVYTIYPPYDGRQEAMETFKTNRDAEMYPTIEPEEMIDRSGHEPRLAKTVEVEWNGTTHEVRIDVERDAYAEDLKYFIRDWGEEWGDK